MINQRIIYQGQKATVRYEGILKHEDKGDEIWLGVEWDEPQRGRHNGTVQNYTYFQTKLNLNSGSLLRKEKVTFGHKLLDALFLKYFKEIPPELLAENAHEQIAQGDLNPESMVITLANQKQVMVEFDHTAFFETIKHKKKMVEFYGFDEIYKKLSNLEKIQELSLESQCISRIGPYGFTAGIFKNLKSLSLEDNLLHSWHQVYCLGNQLKSLKELAISGNYLDHGPQDKIIDHEQKITLDIPVDNCCSHIEVLVLINMRITWKDICQVLPAFRGITELLLCKNTLTDYENIQYSDKELRNLRLLNLENTDSVDFSKIQEAFGDLPQLQKLILSKNNFSQLCQITKFKKVDHVNLDHNLFSTPRFLSQLSAMPLETLSIKHNPLSEKLGKLYVRQRAIAEISTLKIMNGSQITKFERKDSEIFYLKSSFEEYFILKQVKHYYYDLEDFNLYATQHHPKVAELIKKYGNPYEIDPTVKGEFNKPKVQQQQAQFYVLQIVDQVGKLKEKKTEKKFMSNTGIFPVKQVVSKLTGIPLKQVTVSLQIDEESEIILMDGKDMTLQDYGALNGSIIYVNQID